MAGTGPGVVVKNTFLEVGDPLLEKNDVCRRQMSEPVKVFTTENSQLLGGLQQDHEEDTSSEADDDDDECDLIGGAQTPEFATTPVLAHTPAGLPSTAGASPSPSKPTKIMPQTQAQVLLLAESIPAQKAGGSGEKDRDKKDNRPKDCVINQLKNNDITKKEPPWTDVTTVMMRNLPNKYTQQMLLEELHDSGFRLQLDFDFFYLPMDHNNAANLGYCFINFIVTAMANAFAAAFQGKKMRRFNSNKTVVVMPASIQGFEKNYAYYSSTRVVQAEDPAYRPLFLKSPLVGQVAKPTSTPVTVRPPFGGKNSAGTIAASAGVPLAGGGKKPRDKGSGPVIPQSQYSSGGMAMYGVWPGMHGGSVGSWPMQSAPVLQPRVCAKCNHDCSPSHRFCAFCGSFIGDFDKASQMARQDSFLRADAPTFTPFKAAGAGAAQSRMQMPPQARPSGQEAGSRVPQTLGTFHSETVTDELDVMRGRMMLLAALKDMERRDAAPQNNAGAQEDTSGECAQALPALRW